jgi:hypothetical protein
MMSTERKRTIAGKEHALVVLKVTGRDRYGRPRECVIGYDDTKFDIQGGEEFITAWVPAELVGKKAS